MAPPGPDDTPLKGRGIALRYIETSTELALRVFQPAYPLVVEAEPTERAAFIRRTYSQLSINILAFTVLELIVLQTPIPSFGLRFLRISWFSWLMVMAGFTTTARLAEAWADSNMSKQHQYLGVALYITCLLYTSPSPRD